MSAKTEVPRILIADDHPQGVELLEAYLIDTPYEIRTATNGEETLAIAQEWKPHLILLDVMMPRISGFEVCTRLRKDPKTSGMGILMITALDQTADVDRAVEAGTDDFLTKPIHKTELVRRIQSLLECRAESSDLRRTLQYVRGVLRD